MAADHSTLLLSDETRAEVEEVIWRPKFDLYVSDTIRSDFLEFLLASSERVSVTQRIHACRDPRDDKFLEAAVNGGASCIVTGDEDLLVLHPFRSIDILAPRDFLNSVSR
jgi:putative PIN family toxin of toxin-antitoxin system